MNHQKRKRSGFTLLEALLATVISLLLLGGLYVVVDLQVNSTQNSREAIAQATLARALMDRIARDMLASITIKDPGPFRSGQLSYPIDEGSTETDGTSSSGTSGTGSSGTGSSGTSGSGTSGTGTSGSGTGGSSSGGSSGASGGAGSGSGGSSSSGSGSSGASGSSGSQASSQPDAEKMLFLPGIVGVANQVTAFQSVALPKAGSAISANQGATPGAATVPCGIKRVSYWVVGEGDQSQGLARYEASNVSNPNTINPTVLPNEVDDYIIAPEVRSMKISYSDGTQGYWADTWDSRTLSYDSSTPQGPPRAIKIELEMTGADKNTIRRYSQIVAIPVGNTVPLLETLGMGN